MGFERVRENLIQATENGTEAKFEDENDYSFVIIEKSGKLEEKLGGRDKVVSYRKWAMKRALPLGDQNQ